MITTDANGEVVFTELQPGVYCVGYKGGKAVTTQMAVKVLLSSEQQAQVFYGLPER